MATESSITTRRLGGCLLALCALCTLASCGQRQATDAIPSPDYEYAKVVAGIVKLHEEANADWPEHFQGINPPRLGTEFDPNAYFGVLTHLSMADDLVLDYVYELYANGLPYLYTRERSADRFETYPEYEEALGDFEAVCEAEDTVFDNVRADGSPESFFELAVLRDLGGQFYLVWHCNYRRTRIVVSQADVRDIIIGHDTHEFGRAFTQAEKRAAFRMNVEPRIQFVGRREVTVSYVGFYDWRGFVRFTCHFRREFPHTPVMTEVEDLVEYDCGIRF